MSYTEQELADRLQAILSQQSVISGYCRGGGRSGAIATISLPSGGIIQATAVGALPPGECLAILDPDTQEWFAYSAHAAQVTRSQTYRRQTRIQPEAVTGPAKVLFSVVQDGVRSFYVGGDRKNPTKIYSIASGSFLEAFISNTGKRANDWAVAIRYSLDGQQHFVYCRGGTSSSIEISDSSAQGFYYTGHGLWIRNLTGDLDPFKPNQTYPGSTVGVVTASYRYDPYTLSAGTITSDRQDNGAWTWDANLLVSGQFFGRIYRAELITSELNLFHVESFQRTSSMVTTTDLHQSLTGNTYVLPDTLIPVNSIYSNAENIQTRSLNRPISRLIDKDGSQAIVFVQNFSSTTPGGSSTPQGYSPFGYFSSIDNSNFRIGDGQFFAFKADGSSQLITGEIPITPFTPNPPANINFIGDRLYVTPLEIDYRSQDNTATIANYLINSNGTTERTEKQVKTFSLRSPNCTIHSASAFL